MASRGYAIGALVAGLTADALGLSLAMWLVAAVTFVSRLGVALWMRETLKRDKPPGRTPLQPRALDGGAERSAKLA